MAACKIIDLKEVTFIQKYFYKETIEDCFCLDYGCNKSSIFERISYLLIYYIYVDSIFSSQGKLSLQKCKGFNYFYFDLHLKI